MLFSCSLSAWDHGLPVLQPVLHMPQRKQKQPLLGARLSNLLFLGRWVKGSLEGRDFRLPKAGSAPAVLALAQQDTYSENLTRRGSRPANQGRASVQGRGMSIWRARAEGWPAYEGRHIAQASALTPSSEARL